MVKVRALVMGVLMVSSVLTGVVVGCGTSESDEGTVTNNGEGNNGEVDYGCDDGCPAGREQVVDSAARCGYRCVAPATDDNNGAAEHCDRVCPEGTRREQSTQDECGYRCVPVQEEDGSSFNDVDPEFQPDAESDAVEDVTPDVVEDVTEDVSEDVSEDAAEDTSGDADMDAVDGDQ